MYSRDARLNSWYTRKPATDFHRTLRREGESTAQRRMADLLRSAVVGKIPANTNSHYSNLVIADFISPCYGLLRFINHRHFLREEGVDFLCIEF